MIKIALITPLHKIDYLAETVIDGLLRLREEGIVDFYVSSPYPSKYPEVGRLILAEDDFVDFAENADLVLLLWGKSCTNLKLAEKIGKWSKTVYIDGSEVGKNRRYDPEIRKALFELKWDGIGKIEEELLDKCALYFRREKPYIKNIKPLPYGIESEYTHFYNFDKKKDIDFACIFGQEEFPALRRKVREALEYFCQEKGFSCVTGRTSNRGEFYKIFARAKVGISVGGGGFDTARFWEILGNNCILITENIDIFESESTALNYKRIYEFSDIEGFVQKVEEVARLLQKGYNQDSMKNEYEEILKSHSSKARVAYVLDKAREVGIIQ